MVFCLWRCGSYRQLTHVLKKSKDRYLYLSSLEGVGNVGEENDIEVYTYRLFERDDERILSASP